MIWDLFLYLYRDRIAKIRDEITASVTPCTKCIDNLNDDIVDHAKNRPSYTCPLIDSVLKHIGNAESLLAEPFETIEEAETIVGDSAWELKGLNAILENIRTANESLRDEACEGVESINRACMVSHETTQEIDEILDKHFRVKTLWHKPNELFLKLRLMMAKSAMILSRM